MEEIQKNKILSEQDIEEGKMINSIFESLSEKGKVMATAYLSALRDKEMLDAVR